jgi:hypothetical protein
MKIIGDYRLDIPTEATILKLEFRARDFEWRMYGIIADFIAKCLTGFQPFSCKIENYQYPKHELQDIVCFIANELIENQNKFTQNKSSIVSFSLALDNDEVICSAINRISPETFGKFQAHIGKLLQDSPPQLLLQKLEHAQFRGDSGVGFLILLSDYQARLGWKFEEIGQEIVAFCMVRVPLSSVQAPIEMLS